MNEEDITEGEEEDPAWMERGDDGSITVKLLNPVQFGEQGIDSLTFRKITGKDMRRLQTSAKQEIAMCMELAVLISGQVRQVIDKVEGPDLMRVVQVVGGFFADTQETGAR